MKKKSVWSFADNKLEINEVKYLDKNLNENCSTICLNETLLA